MDVSINIVAVLLAAASTMAIGAFWYSPVAFYNKWVKLAKLKVDPNQTTGGQMAVMYTGAFLSSLLVAVVIAYFAGLSHLAAEGNYLNDALVVGFLGWAAFTAGRVHMHDTFENRPKALTLITVGHEFVSIMVMALIIGLFGY